VIMQHTSKSRFEIGPGRNSDNSDGKPTKRNGDSDVQLSVLCYAILDSVYAQFARRALHLPLQRGLCGQRARLPYCGRSGSCWT
jgi:hypothetical protein